MFSDNDTLESLKLKLKSVAKQKLSKQREVLKLRNLECTLSEELNATKAEIECLTEQLEVLKNQITQTNNQISMIDLCTTSEDLKIESHIFILNKHLEGFQQLFDKDRKEQELRMKAQREKEAEQEEFERQIEKQVAEENERQQRELRAVEEECEAIERECTVLKKRNHAIMLKLRKRLLEAENARREALKHNTEAGKETK